MRRVPVFGGTLALKGAIDEQREHKPAHCVEGCWGCELEIDMIFERWLLEVKPQRPIIRKEGHT
jgi:hypothetical protein